jgi:dihydrofolate reductase
LSDKNTLPEKYLTMGKLLLETQVSLDGFMAGVDGETGWMIWNWGPEWGWDEALQAYHTRLHESAGAILISSQMAREGFIAHWRSVARNPADPRNTFARYIDGAPRYVCSETLTTAEAIPGGWENTRVVQGDLRRIIGELKGSVAGDVIVYGGSTLVSSLISLDLVDEYHLIVNPVALGEGLPVFKTSRRLTLVSATAFKSGIVVTRYSK